MHLLCVGRVAFDSQHQRVGLVRRDHQFGLQFDQFPLQRNGVVLDYIHTHISIYLSVYLHIYLSIDLSKF